MLIRIVKMTFLPDQVGRFLELFKEWAPQIRTSPGCQYLELLHDRNDTRIFFTYSQWQDESSLDKYRNSEVFASVWPTVKRMFAEPAQAWSVDREYSAG